MAASLWVEELKRDEIGQYMYRRRFINTLLTV